MVRSRKGQTTSAAPIMVLILLIALFIVLYLLLIPPADRDKLLNRNSSSTNQNNRVDQVNSANTLLLETPGLVSNTKEDISIRNLNPVYLFLRYEPSIKALANSLTVERGSFSGEDRNIFFDISDKERLLRSLLTFAVAENSGKLKVSLNGNIIFDDEIDETSLQIVNLPNSFITDKNEVVFSVSSPGSSFWRTNKYVLQDIKIKEEYELANDREARTFVLSESELNNIDDSRLEFGIYCNSLDSRDTRLRIYLNEEILSSEIITCGTGQRASDIHPDRLVEGENEVLFVIDEGDYLINNIKLVNELKESETRTYFFNINSRDLFDVQDGVKDVFLDMTFDKEGSKIAEIWINDFIIYLDTDSSSFSDNISDLVEEGENFIRILPVNEFLIRSLRITLE